MPDGTNKRRPRLLILVTEDWYFCSHRLGLARFAQAEGFDVCVGTRMGSRREELEAEDFETAHVPFERSLRNPLRDAAAWRAVRGLIAGFRPDIVHLVSLKPILLGGLALGSRGRAHSVSAFTGLGYLFSSSAVLARVLRPAVGVLLGQILRRSNSWTLVQNADDLALLEQAGIHRGARRRVIRGSGIDVDTFRPGAPGPAGSPVVLLPARILVDKGVREFAEAARILRARGVDARFVIAGAHDPANHGAVAPHELDSWARDGTVEWWNYCRDMPEVYAQATLVCLPSYREGLPRALLEAAACGLPLVATAVPGCREICIDGHTGLAVPPRDAQALADAIGRLLGDAALRERLGGNGRALVVEEFSLQRIAHETLALYREILRSAAPPAQSSGEVPG